MMFLLYTKNPDSRPGFSVIVTFVLLLDQKLCDLDSVCSCTLSYLVSAAPEVDAVFVDEVFSDPAYVYDVLI